MSFTFAKVTLELQMSIYQSVCHKNPSASQNCSYQPLSLSTIKPINHQAYWPSSLLTISLLTIKPINHQAHWPLSLSTSGLLLQLLSLLACCHYFYIRWKEYIIEEISWYLYWSLNHYFSVGFLFSSELSALLARASEENQVIISIFVGKLIIFRSNPFEDN